jgi:hypothetical protein
VGKLWLYASKQIGIRSMMVNTGADPVEGTLKLLEDFRLSLSSQIIITDVLALSAFIFLYRYFLFMPIASFIEFKPNQG